MFTKEFWKDTAERVISTAVQALLGILAAGTIVDLTSKASLIAVATASLASLLKAILAVGTVDDSVSPASLLK